LHGPERGLRDVEGTREVGRDHRFDLGRGQLAEGRVTELAGVVHDDVEPGEPRQCGFDDRRTARGIGDRVPVGDRGPAALLDLARDRVRPIAVEVVADDGRPAGGELARVRPAEPVPGAGDDRDLIVEADQSGNP
jgi:hypothetical protein